MNRDIPSLPIQMTANKGEKSANNGDKEIPMCRLIRVIKYIMHIDFVLV